MSATAKPPAPALPAVDPAMLPDVAGTDYPAPFDAAVAGRLTCALGQALGLQAFGVNIVTLPPGCWSSQRHWHSHEDEFVIVLEGVATLVSDSGEQVLGTGQAAGFPRGRADGHHFINHTEAPVRLLVVGNDDVADICHYADADLHLASKATGYSDKNGRPL